jgi:hypothetical protein
MAPAMQTGVGGALSNDGRSLRNLPRPLPANGRTPKSRRLHSRPFAGPGGLRRHG